MDGGRDAEYYIYATGIQMIGCTIDCLGLFIYKKKDLLNFILWLMAW